MKDELPQEIKDYLGIKPKETTQVDIDKLTAALTPKTDTGANVPLDRLVGPACEFCNDTGEKVDHKVEGAPGAVMVFCDCPAGDAVRELIEEASASK